MWDVDEDAVWREDERACAQSQRPIQGAGRRVLRAAHCAAFGIWDMDMDMEDDMNMEIVPYRLNVHKSGRDAPMNANKPKQSRILIV